VSRRRIRRRIEKQLRHAQHQPRVIVREAEGVERLCYTRAEAAEALGVSQSTLKRLLPYIAQVELPWGTKLIPRDELERLIAERRREARKRRPPPRSGGRPATVPSELVERIRAEHAAGKSLAQIARKLNANGTPTAHGGRQWWPSTVQAILRSHTRRPQTEAAEPVAVTVAR
jgi:DNA invertase Pin-like site-specific DNA recombinase